ncbi:signal peptidase II [Oricola thermophila]|uniref:Lipoprotein signal peptidase n=1 Tax=Oricola thermophila TaxID=2742145 RepID=A0A6N1VF34_9HYPH|nr:signal peptidase II [Oricola thermophila]QKV19560.1 signal peptidase II [Oricola thermophila]
MKRPAAALGTIGLVVAIDQAAKYATERFMAYQRAIDILPFFALYRTHNEGIAFSMLWGLGPGILIAISLGVIAFVLWLWRASPAERVVSHAGFALVIGGAIGNLIDRAVFGYVIDYFLFHTPAWSFAVFNLADAAITVGAGLIILDELMTWRRERAIEKSE